MAYDPNELLYKSVFCTDNSESNGVATDHFSDECFVIADAGDSPSHAGAIARYTAETAVWGYKLIRQRNFYWSDKQLLLKRIFRSVNIALWQKRRDPEYKQIMVSLAVIILGKEKCWIGWIGTNNIVIVRNAAVFFRAITSSDDVIVHQRLGVRRFGVVPRTYRDEMINSDTIIAVNCGIWRHTTDAVMIRVAVEYQKERACEMLHDGMSRESETEEKAAIIIRRLG